MIYWKHGFFMMAAIAVLIALAWWAQWEITDDYRTDNERLRDHISRRNSEDIGRVYFFPRVVWADPGLLRRVEDLTGDTLVIWYETLETR